MREEFERWYLQVMNGHPNNLTKDDEGGYKYLGDLYLGWEAATLIEREACAKACKEESGISAELGHERFSRYSAEMARKIMERSISYPTSHIDLVKKRKVNGKRK